MTSTLISKQLATSVSAQELKERTSTMGLTTGWELVGLLLELELLWKQLKPGFEPDYFTIQLSMHGKTDRLDSASDLDMSIRSPEDPDGSTPTAIKQIEMPLIPPSKEAPPTT